jgi:hypothetical protein
VLLAKRVTYFAEGGPRSRATKGLIKVGQSGDPERRARALNTRLLGVTSLGEGVLREMLAPFLVSPEEIKERGLEHAREWFYDAREVRRFVAWVCELHPPSEAVSAALSAQHAQAGLWASHTSEDVAATVDARIRPAETTP